LHLIVAKDRPRLLVKTGPGYWLRPDRTAARAKITVTRPRNAGRRPARRSFDAKPVPV
jgi:hypothetical protein